LRLTDNSNLKNSVTRTLGGPVETLYVGENDSESAILDILCVWTPETVSGAAFHWRVENLNGTIPDPNPWSPTGRAFDSSGSPGTDSTTWTNPDPDGTVTREFKARVWLDSDNDAMFDSQEPTIDIPVTIVKIKRIEILANGTWTRLDGPPTEVLLLGTIYKFRAILDPDTASDGMLSWSGLSSDNGATTQVTFDEAGTGMPLTAIYGASRKTAAIDVIKPTLARMSYEKYDIDDREDK
jgi:hypothetical protein